MPIHHPRPATLARLSKAAMAVMGDKAVQDRLRCCVADGFTDERMGLSWGVQVEARF